MLYHHCGQYFNIFFLSYYRYFLILYKTFLRLIYNFVGLDRAEINESFEKLVKISNKYIFYFINHAKKCILFSSRYNSCPRFSRFIISSIIYEIDFVFVSNAMHVPKKCY